MPRHQKLYVIGAVLSLFLSFVFVLCAEGSAVWSQTYGEANYEGAYALVATSDGGYAVAGSLVRPDGEDFWLIKTDANGTKQWNQTYPGLDYDFAHALVQASDGGFAIAGDTSDKKAFRSDFWLVKTDPLGNMKWNKSYGGEGKEFAEAVIQTSDGGYAMAGASDSFSVGLQDFWLVKTDADGNLEWSQMYGTVANEHAYSLVQASDGGYVLAGTSNVVDSNIWVVKTDPLGNIQWNQTYGGAGNDGGSGAVLIKASSGGYAVATDTSSFGAGGDDFWLIKLDADGNAEWNQTYGGSDDDWTGGLIQTRDGGYALAGSLSLFGSGHGDVWLVKTDGSSL
jgi:predicted secreted protein